MMYTRPKVTTSVTEKAVTPIPRKTVRQQRLKLAVKNWQLYIFLLVPVAYLLIFRYYPMLGVQIAFKKFNAAKGIWGSPWVEFYNFEKFFKSYQFSRVISNTLSLSFYGLLAGFPIPIILGLCLNALRSQRYKKLAQTIIYVPHFISTVVLVGIVLQVFNPLVGVYGVLYSLATNGNIAPDILGKATAFSHMYVWSGVWQNMGWGTIIYVAALSSVENELHEAAQIDGASRFKRVIHIDLPKIFPTATTLLILNAGSIMNVGFEKVYLMQNSLNLRQSEVISTYVYKIGLAAGGGDFSYATAIGLFNSIINFMLLVTVNWISKKISSTSLW